MPNSIEEIQRSLQQLAAHLSRHREEILDAWRDSVQNDSKLQDVSQWTRACFRDHIPFVLDIFQNKLASWPAENTPRQEAQQRAAADAHSRHRWQQGYELRSLVREWGHLNQCLVQVLHDYTAQRAASNDDLDSDLEAAVLREAQELWAQLLNDCVSENVVEYYRLLQSEAATRALEIEQALEHVRALEAERGQLLRSAAHDLKGNLSVVMSSASMMEERHLSRLSPSERAQLHQLFQQGFGSLNEMLSDLMSMARLEAGQEQRNVAPFDASQLLTLLCSTSQPLARQHDLYLRAQGPDTLWVEGDAVKVQRIAQNLLLNSLKYTQHGGVTLTWGQSEHAEGLWELCIEDTGPGLQSGSAAPLAHAMQGATESARDVEDDGKNTAESETPATFPHQKIVPSTVSAPTKAAVTAGEGVGLAIVKRLCQLLNASIDLKSSPGVGSTIRIVFPSKYND